jgi:hypothetical protein
MFLLAAAVAAQIPAAASRRGPGQLCQRIEPCSLQSVHWLIEWYSNCQVLSTNSFDCCPAAARYPASSRVGMDVMLTRLGSYVKDRSMCVAVFSHIALV